jgi:hypothetical protein
MEDQIINKVDQSGIITIDLEKYYTPGARAVIDLKDILFQGMILREKDLREFVKTNDWSTYSGKFVAVTCSADAIIPTWAFVLVTLALEPFARLVIIGSAEELESTLYRQSLSSIDPAAFIDARVVIKGCSNLPVPPSAYAELSMKLRPVAKSIMYGEPCSTVPLYKKAK